MSQENGWLCSGMISIGYGLIGPYLVVCRTGVEIRVFRVGRSLFLHPVEENTNGGNYGDLVAGTRPGKKNHEAVASRQLAPAHVTAPDYDLLMSRENQQKQTAGSTAGIMGIGIKSTKELRPRNHTRISTTRSVTSYLLDWCQKSNWCRQKNSAFYITMEMVIRWRWV